MSIVTFLGNNNIETAQTASMAGIATYLSLEQNYKILLINTKYNDTSLQECFWKNSKSTKANSDLATGISGVIQAIKSNKTSPEIITNYTKTIFKKRLELLTDEDIKKEKYESQKSFMKSIIKMANRYYDLVFVDIKGSTEDSYIQEILEESSLIVATTTQRMKFIKDFFDKIKEQSSVLKKDKMIFLIGKYDRFSKYNIKNLQRMEKIKEIYGIPYNTLFFEACDEGLVADFIINYRQVKVTNINAPIMEAISKIGHRIIEKLKEMQIQL